METRLLEWLLECAPFGVAWYAGDGRVRLNAEAARLAGIEEREVPLPHWARKVRLVDDCGRELEDLERPLFAALGGRRIPRTRMEVLRADGTRAAVAVQSLPWPSGDRPGAVVLVEDITWSLEAEKRQSEWLGALGHELNGALQQVSATAAAAERCLQVDPPRAKIHLGSTREQCATMGRLVRDFISAARLGAGTLECRVEPVPLDLFLQQCAQTAELTDPRHKVVLKLEQEELWAVTDLDRLRQILVNLFSNAARYANPGLLELGARRDGDRVVLWLRDEGPGIPVEAQSGLFQRFHRLPSRVDGAGLGLWLSRELAQLMGGDLWLNSRHLGGTTFFVGLPAATHAEQTGEQELIEATPAQGA